MTSVLPYGDFGSKATKASDFLHFLGHVPTQKGHLYEAQASYYRIDAKNLAGNGRLLPLPYIEPSLYNETIKPGRKIKGIEDK